MSCNYDDALTTNATLRQILKNTLDVLPQFVGGNSWPQYPPSRVRLQDYPTQTNSTWHTLIAIMANIPTNGITGDPPGAMTTGMEGGGGIGIVNELLLQTFTGTIELFPQVPPGQPAAFTNLRGRGAFLISASMATGNRDQISNVTIVSEKGGTVNLRSPWALHPSISVVAVPLRGSSGAATAVRNMGSNIFSWISKPGTSYAVAPK